MPMSPRYVKLLTIAGSDSGGGAGIQADIKTFAGLGGYAMSVITSLTAQNTQTVTAIYPLTPAFIGEQMDAVFSDMGVDAVKIGMLNDVGVVRVIKEKLIQYAPQQVVLDPVMVSKGGVRLLTHEAIRALPSDLFPHVHLITPNIPEAELLLGQSITTRTQMVDAAVSLAQTHQLNVLVKGGHLAGEESADVLYDLAKGSVVWFEGARISTRNTHGTGCTFSSAITAFLAFGDALPVAIARAKAYLRDAIELGKDHQLGQGQGPVNHVAAGRLHQII